MWGVASHAKFQHLRVTLNETGYRRAAQNCQTVLFFGGVSV